MLMKIGIDQVSVRIRAFILHLVKHIAHAHMPNVVRNDWLFLHLCILHETFKRRLDIISANRIVSIANLV